VDFFLDIVIIHISREKLCVIIYFSHTFQV